MPLMGLIIVSLTVSIIARTSALDLDENFLPSQLAEPWRKYGKPSTSCKERFLRSIARMNGTNVAR